MSKKDYQAIARAIFQARESGKVSDVVQAIADVMEASNSRFDRARFLEVCETGTCKGMRRAK